MVRRLAPPFLLALLAGAALMWTSMSGGWLWTDYEYANVEPFRAVTGGHWSAFFHAAPIEGPSLLLRVPFAFIPSLWGGGDDAIFWTVAIPGVLAGILLGTLLHELRGRGLPGARGGLIVLLLAAANPISFRALEIGHPEEIMGAALCVGAVLAAVRGRAVLATVLLGVAIGNKAWAVLALGPVLLALEPGQRVRAGLGACAIAGLIFAPFLLSAGGRGGVAQAASTDAVFQPWQIFWFIGDHDGTIVRGFGNAMKPDYRTAPGWIAPVTHPLIVALTLPASIAWSRWRRGDRSDDLLLLLALLLLARCFLDVANNAYYHVPFLLALLAWEAVRCNRPPVLSLAAAALVWLTCVRTADAVGPDAQAALYIAVVVPAFVALTAMTYGVRWRPARRARLLETA